MFHKNSARIGLSVILSITLILVSVSAFAAEEEAINVSQVAVSDTGIVTSAHPLASKAGAQMLSQGGNAVDAAVATAFALSVVEPYASGLGGEGVATIGLADGQDVIVDYKSVAPGHVTEETKIDVNYGAEGAAVPGVVAGLAHSLEKYGTMSLEEVLQPAIDLARNGFPMDEVFHDTLSAHGFYEKMVEEPEKFNLNTIAKRFLEEGLLPEVGTTIRNPELANALELIAEKGASSFYEGQIAESMEKATDGWISREDLKKYRPIEREPVSSDYRDYMVLSPPPPVGGAIVVEELNILENFNLSQLGRYDHPLAVHLISQATMLGSRDGATFRADPDFADIPIEGLASDEYATERAKLINMGKAMEERRFDVPQGNPGAYQTEEEGVEEASSPSTSQISVVDGEGNAVSMTNTNSYFWGSQLFVEEYGFVLNNEIHNFTPAKYKTLNTIAPYKRPRTVIAPSIVRRKDGSVYLVVGTPGAGRITTTIVETIVNMVDFKMPLTKAIKSPKFTSRLWYGELRMEEGFPEETIEELKNMGHEIKLYSPLDLYFGGVNAVHLTENNMLIGVGSYRRDGAAAT
ncbi:gamma-glutamyltransferase, partial [Candidatus Bipolaricaulota bacterium]|nr:gamma-glutamyltransferase [Candidatus Bipolaricaulota bacterium]